MLTVSAAARHDLSDAQWALLEPLLAPTAPCGRPRRWPIRGLVDGVRHRARAGCPWRDVPVRYGPWWRVYALFACWQLLGVWARVEAALRQAADRNGRFVAGSGVGRLHHRTRPRPRRRRPPRQRESGCGRTRSPRAGSLPRRLGHQNPRRDRPAPRSAVVPAHPWPGRRQPAVHPRARADPDRPTRARPTTATTRPCPGGQGLLLPREPGLAAPAQNRSDDPGPGRPARSPAAPRILRRASTRVRRRAVQGPPRHRGRGSTTSSTIARSPPGTTSSPSAAPPLFTSPASTTGSDDFRNRP